MCKPPDDAFQGTNIERRKQRGAWQHASVTTTLAALMKKVTWTRRWPEGANQPQNGSCPFSFFPLKSNVTVCVCNVSLSVVAWIIKPEREQGEITFTQHFH